MKLKKGNPQNIKVIFRYTVTKLSLKVTALLQHATEYGTATMPLLKHCYLRKAETFCKI